MERIITFTEYLFEDDGGGGVGMATLNGNGMGRVVAPTVGSTPGSVSQSGHGTVGSGDSSAYDMGKKFGQFINKEKKGKGKKAKNKKEKPVVYTKAPLPW